MLLQFFCWDCALALSCSIVRPEWPVSRLTNHSLSTVSQRSETYSKKPTKKKKKPALAQPERLTSRPTAACFASPGVVAVDGGAGASSSSSGDLDAVTTLSARRVRKLPLEHANPEYLQNKRNPQATIEAGRGRPRDSREAVPVPDGSNLRRGRIHIGQQR